SDLPLHHGLHTRSREVYSRRFFLLSPPILLNRPPLGEAHALDEAPRPLGERIRRLQELPERLAVVGVDAVRQLMRDYVVDHPLRPALDAIADADVPVRRAAGRAAPQPLLHVAHPADRPPGDLPAEVRRIDVLRPRLQVGVGAAFGERLLP